MSGSTQYAGVVDPDLKRLIIRSAKKVRARGCTAITACAPKIGRIQSIQSSCIHPGQTAAVAGEIAVGVIEGHGAAVSAAQVCAGHRSAQLRGGQCAGQVACSIGKNGVRRRRDGLQRTEHGVTARAIGFDIHFQPIIAAGEDARAKVNAGGKQTVGRGNGIGGKTGADLSIAQRILVQLESKIIEAIDRASTVVQAALIGEQGALGDGRIDRGEQTGQQSADQQGGLIFHIRFGQSSLSSDKKAPGLATPGSKAGIPATRQRKHEMCRSQSKTRQDY